MGNEHVNDVAVTGIEWKEEHTEVPKAFVVRSGPSKASGRSDKEEAGDIARWLDSYVASYKRLRGRVKFVDAIPKSATGKVLRWVLKKQQLDEQEELRGMAKL